MGVDYEQDEIPYDDAVERGGVIISEMEDYQFELGMLASKLEPKYGEKTLYQFAADIGIDYETLKTYRTTYQAWKDEPSRPASFSIARVLNKHPYKHQVFQEIIDTENMSVAGAKEKMREWREERGGDKKAKKGSSVNAIHRRKTIIIRELNAFLSQRSPLRQMIQELNERDSTDFYYIEEIVEALLDAAKRIRATIDELNIIAPVK
jgi:hypothetical protein